MPAAGHVNPPCRWFANRSGATRRLSITSTTSSGLSSEGAGARWRPYPPHTISAHVIAEATRTGGPLAVVAQGLPATETLVPFPHEEPAGGATGRLIVTVDSTDGQVTVRAEGRRPAPEADGGTQRSSRRTAAPSLS